MVKDNRRQRDPVTKDLWDLVLIGIVVQAVGGTIVWFAWPGTEKVAGHCNSITGECDPDTTEETGSVLFTALGSVIGSAGAMVVLAAVIGFGVLMGLRARATET